MRPVGRGRGWASGGPRSPGSQAVSQPRVTEAPTPEPPASKAPASTAPAAAERAGEIAAAWGPTLGRLLLGLVFVWFGYHEIVQPGNWTQYVPVISETSRLATVLVAVHGWVLLALATALLLGIAPRLSAAIASLLMLEIVIALAVNGLSDTTFRDVGVLGLAIVLTGSKNQRLVMRL